jgi:DNA-binding CsgD family transcriptional regulator
MAYSKESYILTHLDDIREWKRLGITDVQVCRILGISKSTLYKHRNNNADIADALKKGSLELAVELRGELVRQSKFHTLTTRKTYVRVDESGKETEYTEITEQEKDGSIGAIHLLLKNIDPEHWKENWDNYRFKKMEVDLKKRELKLKEKWHEDDW